MTAQPGPVVVVGGGPAGLTCATTLANAGVAVTLIDREGMGGRLVNADLVTGVAGETAPRSGAEIAGDLSEAAMTAGVRVEFGEVESLTRDAAGAWTVSFGSEVVVAPTVVLAAGSDAKDPEVPDVERFVGKGISRCAACDGPLFRGKDVVVLLGDEWGADEVVQVARSAKSVRALIQPDYDRRLDEHLSRIEGLESVTVERDVTPSAIHGEQVVATIEVGVGQGRRSIATDGIFTSIGTVPNTSLLVGLAELDESGAAIVDDGFRTTAAGLFAVGEARVGSDRTAAQSIADGLALGHLLVSQNLAVTS